MVRGRCLEIGCGAGRLTRAMAGCFERLDALDVSEAMLEYARSRITMENVDFHLVDGRGFPFPEQCMDAVFSTHVFQHLDSRDDAGLYFNEIARVLNPGGSMMVHLPVSSWPPGAGSVLRSLYRMKKRLGDLQAALKRIAIRSGKSVRLMRLQSFEVGWLYAQLSKSGLSDIEISIFTTRSNNDPHPFVLARKEA